MCVPAVIKKQRTARLVIINQQGAPATGPAHTSSTYLDRPESMARRSSTSASLSTLTFSSLLDSVGAEYANSTPEGSAAPPEVAGAEAAAAGVSSSSRVIPHSLSSSALHASCLADLGARFQSPHGSFEFFPSTAC